MAKLVLELHDWHRIKPDEGGDLIAEFLFTLVPAAERERGMKPSPSRVFWTRVRISSDLASRGRWSTLSRDEKTKAMYRFAVDRITATGRMLRETPMFWRPGSPLTEGPPWDVSTIAFPKPRPIVFEGPAEEPDVARKAAGLE